MAALASWSVKTRPIYTFLTKNVPPSPGGWILFFWRSTGGGATFEGSQTVCPGGWIWFVWRPTGSPRGVGHLDHSEGSPRVVDLEWYTAHSVGWDFWSLPNNSPRGGFPIFPGVGIIMRCRVHFYQIMGVIMRCRVHYGGNYEMYSHPWKRRPSVGKALARWTAAKASMSTSARGAQKASARALSFGTHSGAQGVPIYTVHSL